MRREALIQAQGRESQRRSGQLSSPDMCVLGCAGPQADNASRSQEMEQLARRRAHTGSASTVGGLGTLQRSHGIKSSKVT